MELLMFSKLPERLGEEHTLSTNYFRLIRYTYQNYHKVIRQNYLTLLVQN
jgi:hypothetical protein